MSQYFHLTIGPVQGFVAQARRSKDLWSGSFLLSWLSGVAIAILEKQKHKNAIIFPIPERRFIDAIDGSEPQGPMQGGIPNRFKSMTAKVSDGFNAKEVPILMQSAWAALAEHVWNNDLIPFLQKYPQYQMTCRTVWERQIAAIWEISWVITEDEAVSNLLDERKNWRNHYAPPEPGEKCMVMAGWQELSGLDKAAERKMFWQALRKNLNFGNTDIDEKEQLCALAFVKRRFAHYFSSFELAPNNWPVADQLSISLEQPKLKGWSFSLDTSGDGQEDYDPSHVPSLPFVAALPWLKKLIDNAQSERQLESIKHFSDQSKSLYGLPSSQVNFMHLTRNYAESIQGGKALPPYLLKLDGESFYEHRIRANERHSLNKKQALLRALQTMQKSMNVGKPSPFYALLMMDGDSLGSQMSDKSKQQGISAALNQFTAQVPSVVAKYDGFLAYAGGDDVLAILPFDMAISCARALHQTYRQCFIENKGTTNLFSTLSGAIQFAHCSSPLMKIVSESHGLLDEVAKEQTGRDSLAIRINKPGGKHAQWSMPWEKLYSGEKNCVNEAVQCFNELPDYITSKLLFKLIESLSVVAFGNILSEQELQDVAVAEYMHSGKQLHLKEEGIQKDATQHIQLLLNVCSVFTRQLNADTLGVSYTESSELNLDGLKLIRFLASGGILEQGAEQ